MTVILRIILREDIGGQIAAIHIIYGGGKPQGTHICQHQTHAGSELRVRLLAIIAQILPVMIVKIKIKAHRSAEVFMQQGGKLVGLVI